MRKALDLATFFIKQIKGGAECKPEKAVLSYSFPFYMTSLSSTYSSIKSNILSK